MSEREIVYKVVWRLGPAEYVSMNLTIPESYVCHYRMFEVTKPAGETRLLAFSNVTSARFYAAYLRHLSQDERWSLIVLKCLATGVIPLDWVLPSRATAVKQNIEVFWYDELAMFEPRLQPVEAPRDTCHCTSVEPIEIIPVKERSR